ncbi:FAD-dependent monooxygenase [Spongiactinospora sp. TRM90649]|uniref:FAD-dependent monooxygenase n=1 Tax=Spongiactinospora sp. TRM90649 TaxID=3031114 RepID=UPI0023F8C96F|nr:FAD-dependent monooxygenase [Spongiactinospora sp. TRM90649]MDF5752911.1 FAD-dependent monooxygenase [Spongiactinospora sp. TRM90649]
MKALIIGCGIGGPAAAMALRRAGIDAEIYEAYSGVADHAGSFLNIASNGLDALRVLDVHRDVMAAGIPTPHMDMHSGTGKRLGRVANGMRLDDGTVSHTVLRADLYRIVRDRAVAQGVPVHHGKRLTGIDRSDPRRVVARFEDGTEAVGDLLIGADGLRSRTREILDPAAPTPRYSGLIGFGGIIEGHGFTGEPGVYNMIFGRRAFFGYTVASGQTWWFANLPVADEPSRERLANTDWKPALLDAFAGDANRSADMIRATADIGRAYPIHDLPSIPVWHRGRVVLTGDAAHATSPSSGQGASLAAEDGLLLAKCLRDLGDHGRAFTEFERLRRARAERVVAYSRTISNSKAAGPIARVFRDLLMPIFLRRTANSDALSWMYHHHIDWDTRLAA